MKTAIIDMDGTICEERPTFERSMAAPLPGAVAGMERLRSQGYYLVIYTARGWGEYAMTMDWLGRFGVPFDALLCGKPVGDIWIDDRAVQFRGWENI